MSTNGTIVVPPIAVTMNIGHLFGAFVDTGRDGQEFITLMIRATHGKVIGKKTIRLYDHRLNVLKNVKAILTRDGIELSEKIEMVRKAVNAPAVVTVKVKETTKGPVTVINLFYCAKDREKTGMVTTTLLKGKSKITGNPLWKDKSVVNQGTRAILFTLTDSDHVVTISTIDKRGDRLVFTLGEKFTESHPRQPSKPPATAAETTASQPGVIVAT